MVTLFDSLTHPTLSGQWLGRDLDATFETLVQELAANGIGGACAVGLEGRDGYDHEAFMTRCRQHSELVPIAGYSPKGSPGIADDLAALGALGFAGIKVHPRFSGLDLRDPLVLEAFVEAGRQNLTVFLCTYNHGPVVEYPQGDPFLHTVELLRGAPETRVVLVHGGDAQLLRYAELVRHNPNVLLDLSYTLLAYEGSSLDADIRFLFERRDRRICVGSDHPEFRPAELRRRFDEFGAGIASDALENIGQGNLRRLLGVD